MTGMFIVSLRANNRRQFFSVPMYQEGSPISDSGRVSTSGPIFISFLERGEMKLHGTLYSNRNDNFTK